MRADDGRCSSADRVGADIGELVQPDGGQFAPVLRDAFGDLAFQGGQQVVSGERADAVSGANGSPTSKSATASENRCSNASAIASSTRKRLAQMQLWPAF